MLNWSNAVRRQHSATPFPKMAPLYRKQLRATAIGTFKNRPVTVALKDMSVPKRQNYWNKFPIISKLATTNVNDAPSYHHSYEHTDCHGQYRNLATSLLL